MKEKPVKLPGPDHPIFIEPKPARVVVSVEHWDDSMVASS